jgi:hypothetical protein
MRCTNSSRYFTSDRDGCDGVIDDTRSEIRKLQPGMARAFAAVAWTCVAFVALTFAAMLVYPGGRVGDRGSMGYSFFVNFFSDLGETVTHSKQDNLASLVLFALAMSATAAGISTFFYTFVLLFEEHILARRVATVGAVAAGVTSLCFIGVALAPWNLYRGVHLTFVIWGFRAYLIAAVCAIVAVLASAPFPRRFAVAFAPLTVLLACNGALLIFGPPPTTTDGAIVQATAQKIVVYASVATMFVQSLLARRYVRIRPSAAP